MKIHISEVEIKEIVRQFLLEQFGIACKSIVPHITVNPHEISFTGMDVVVANEVSIDGTDVDHSIVTGGDNKCLLITKVSTQ